MTDLMAPRSGPDEAEWPSPAFAAASLEQPHADWSYDPVPPHRSARRAAVLWVLVLVGIVAAIGSGGFYLLTAGAAGAAGARGGG